ncbi:MAG: ABC transporter ATP-binding protein [Candidatus Omnitrophica bacterium]|nr:ABC transporter ATP-binding protein [Candidatus Omnitrophota bacterium]
MTTFPAKIPAKNNPVELAKALELVSVGKKYALQAGQISKKIVGGDFWALKDVSLDVFSGKILGVLGRNGAGKTTLLNIISGVFPPTEGKIISQGRVLGLFNLGVGFQDEFTGRENIFLNGAILGASRKELNVKLNKIIEFSELDTFIDMPLGTYSQGMRLRLGFSIIANLNFDILVIDEVLTVGDTLFQDKCYERIVGFKKQGKTLIITNQDMGIIERLCDEAALLDHGRLLFKGNPSETINRYKALLNTEGFFVGTINNDILVKNTKKWADDMSGWGKKFGTKEVVIESVDFINKFGFKVSKIKSRGALKIKVNFNAKDKIYSPHFGIAVFRNDGVYCYGPNTKFDNYEIKELKPGKGYFILAYDKLLLAPGIYRISVAIWDKNEKIAFDYHNGFYTLTVEGIYNEGMQLLNMPYRITSANNYSKTFDCRMIKLFDASGKEKNVFMTNQPLNIMVNFSDNGQKYSLLQIYRDDRICCQIIRMAQKNNKAFSIFFPKLALLPGCYTVSAGMHNSTCLFNMVFNKNDHGTVYMEHKWIYSGR